MDKYIKINDLLEKLNDMQKIVKQDYEQGKMSYSSMIAMTGVIESLRQDVVA
jgi:hypothetical protein